MSHLLHAGDRTFVPSTQRWFKAGFFTCALAPLIGILLISLVGGKGLSFVFVILKLGPFLMVANLLFSIVPMLIAGFIAFLLFRWFNIWSIWAYLVIGPSITHWFLLKIPGSISDEEWIDTACFGVTATFFFWFALWGPRIKVVIPFWVSNRT